ncbi:MAG: GNAT family N-acetyltransferase [Thermotogota bacterium]
MITLKNVTQENFWECIELSVSKEQSEYVTTNAVSIAQSKVQPECKPMCVYDDDLLVGFLMYCIDSDDGEYWIYRLMIDEKYQSKGYGEEALKTLIKTIKEDKEHNKIYLGVHIDSIKAVNLYKKYNFDFNGQVYGSEHIMVLNY